MTNAVLRRARRRRGRAGRRPVRGPRGRAAGRAGAWPCRSCSAACPPRPRSGTHRPGAGAAVRALAPGDLPAIVGLAVGGRCRRCGEPLARGYLAVEAACALGWAAADRRGGLVGRAGAGARPGHGPDRHVGGRPRRHAHPHALRLRHARRPCWRAPRSWPCSTARPAGWRAPRWARWRWVGSCWSSTWCRPGRSGSATCGSAPSSAPRPGGAPGGPTIRCSCRSRACCNAGLLAGLVGSVVGLALLVGAAPRPPVPVRPGPRARRARRHAGHGRRTAVTRRTRARPPRPAPVSS